MNISRRLNKISKTLIPFLSSDTMKQMRRKFSVKQKVRYGNETPTLCSTVFQKKSEFL